MLRVYLFFFLMATFGGIGYTAYNYYQNTQETIAVLRENNFKLETAAATLQNTVNTMEEEAAKNAELTMKLQMRLQESEAGLDRLRKRFSEIDITREALEDAEDLERRINRGVDRLIRQIFEDTGGIAPDTSTDGVSENAGANSSNAN